MKEEIKTKKRKRAGHILIHISVISRNLWLVRARIRAVKRVSESWKRAAMNNEARKSGVVQFVNRALEWLV